VFYGTIECLNSNETYNGDLCYSKKNRCIYKHGYGETTKNGYMSYDKWENDNIKIKHCEIETCLICTKFTKSCDFDIPCNYCNGKVCKSCYKQLFKPITNGCYILKSMINCPHCTQINKKLNIDEELINIMKKSSSAGKCLKCEQYVSINEICGQETNINNMFICTQCEYSIKHNFKACPNCEIMILKIGGCNHMKCTMCKKEFCWNCLDEWGPKHRINGECMTTY